jgi:hypothetical protein
MPLGDGSVDCTAACRPGESPQLKSPSRKAESKDDAGNSSCSDGFGGPPPAKPRPRPFSVLCGLVSGPDDSASGVHHRSPFRSSRHVALQDHAQPDDALRARGLAADKYRELTFTVVPVASRSQ